MNQKQYYVYFMINFEETTLYIGVTSDLERRIYQHKNKLFEGFSKRYNLKKLVYYEIFDDVKIAIEREKYLKGKTRRYKNDLVRSFNPDWKDLYNDIIL